MSQTVYAEGWTQEHNAAPTFMPFADSSIFGTEEIVVFIANTRRALKKIALVLIKLNLLLNRNKKQIHDAPTPKWFGRGCEVKRGPTDRRTDGTTDGPSD